MNRKRNVNYIKPEDPEFLKVLKRQAGYDDRNHKFDELQNSESDFVDDDDSEQPQVVVLRKGDLTAEEAEIEQKKIEKNESETKADLNQKVIFKSKPKDTISSVSKDLCTTKRKNQCEKKSSSSKKSRPVLSFDDEEDEDGETTEE